MKTRLLLALGFTAALAVLAYRPASAGDYKDPKIGVDHLYTALLLEEKAKGLDELILQHKAMMQNAGSGQIMLPDDKNPLNSKLVPIKEHCQDIINDSARLRDKLLGLARWHREQAAKQGGK